MRKIAIEDVVRSLDRYFQPVCIARANGHEVKVVKARGEFPWHLHEQEDEVFLVWEGELRIETREEIHLLHRGESLVVPRRTEHRVVAAEECVILLFEPIGVVNTGNIVDARYTAPAVAAEQVL